MGTPKPEGAALGVSQARPLTDSTSVPVSAPPAAPEPTPVAEPAPGPAPAPAPAPQTPPTLVTGPVDGGEVVTAAASPCDGEEVVVTVSIDVQALAAGEPEFNLVVHSPTDDGTESELHFDGDWADVQGLVADLPPEGSCVLVLAEAPSEDEDAAVKVEADAAVAAETGTAPEYPFP